MKDTQGRDQMDSAMFSIEAEQQLIGLMLISEESYYRCNDVLKPDHFFEPVHARIFDLIGGRVRNGSIVSPVIMKTLMAGDEGLEALGGPAYLARIAAAAISVYEARDYAIMLVQLWQRRTVMDALSKAEKSVSNGDDISESVRNFMDVIDLVQEGSGKQVSSSYLKILVQAVEAADSAGTNGNANIKTGMADLDDLFMMRPGDMVVLAGAPSSGKTSLALSLAHMAADAGSGVALASLEMTGESLAYRALSEATGVPYADLMRGNLDEEKFRKIAGKAIEIQNRPIQVIEPHVKDLHSLNAALMRIKRIWEKTAHPLGLVLIDYLQLVRAPGKTEYERITAASRGIKALAMQLGVPVIALAQLRAGDLWAREDNRPRLSDIKGSGDIEADADTILFVHRQQYFLERKGAPTKDSERADYEADLATSKNKAEIICAKQRSGAIGSVNIGMHVPTNRVWSLRETQVQEMQF